MTRRSTCGAVLILLILAPGGTLAKKKDDRLSKKETALLWERVQEGLRSDHQRYEPYVLQADVQLLFQEGLPAGEFTQASTDASTFKRELVLPGWHAGEIRTKKASWRWSGEGHQADMQPVADVVSRALWPSSHLQAAKVRGRGRRVADGESLLVELELSYGVAVAEASSASLVSWRRDDVLFEYEDLRRAGSLAWPSVVRVSRGEQPLLRIDCREPSLGGDAVPATLFEPPAGATLLTREGMEGLTPPRLISTRNPPYQPQGPEDQGVVIIRAIIGTDGRVADAEVLRGVTPELDGAALWSVRQRVYQPGNLHGQAVEVISTIRIIFKRP